MTNHDPVQSPRHYTSHPRFTCECIEIARLMTFGAGNAFKYLWRYTQKNGAEDLQKAGWYLKDIEKFLLPVWIDDEAAMLGMALYREHVEPFLNAGDDDADKAMRDLVTRT